MFTRKNNDLHITKNISLTEALCGFEMEIQHLDGRKLYFSYDKTIQPDSSKCVANEGMPVFKDPFSKGFLIIHFKVKLPELSKEKIPHITNILDENIKKIKKNSDVEEYLLQEINTYQEIKSENKNIHEEDVYEENDNQQGVECHQQ